MVVDLDLVEVEPELAVPLGQMSKDLRKTAGALSKRDARWLIDEYYTHQDARIRAAHQDRTREEQAEPHSLVGWCHQTSGRFERSMKAALGVFGAEYRVGQWCQAQCGIAQVLSASMLAHFDIRKAVTVGHFWRFAGLDPTSVWGKKQKCPWNQRLKAICTYRMGESFVKTQNREKSFYGKILIEKKVKLTEANMRGDFKGRSEGELEKWKDNVKMKKSGRWEHWEHGRLAPAHIHDMARRWAVKLFLSHLHHVMFQDFYKSDPPAPYIFEHPSGNGQDHRHLIQPPLWPGDYDGRRLDQMKD